MAENEYKTYTGKNVQEALAAALRDLQGSEEEIEYDVLEKGTSGFLGFKARPAEIRARRRKSELELAMDRGRTFLEDVFREMGLTVAIDMQADEAEKVISINLSGEKMGVLIGKRGQTLDSLQHLAALVINRGNEDYFRVKLDTENYRERRKETLEMLAKNVASRVARTRKPAALEAMNPYERRIIHMALQNDKYVTTKSEGEEPYRHVVVLLKKDAPLPKYSGYDGAGGRRGGRRGYGGRRYSGGSESRRNYSSFADTVEGKGETDGYTDAPYFRSDKDETGSDGESSGGACNREIY